MLRTQLGAAGCAACLGVNGEIMNIRIATTQDRDDIQRVYSSAFPKGEGEIVSRLAIDLLAESTTPPTISLLAEADGAVVGHVGFSPVTLDGDANCQAYILAPLAVQPEYQQRRIGSQLVEHGMQQLAAMGVNIVFVYGDPDYYGRFGFSVDAAHKYVAPYRLEHPFGWQAMVLEACDIEEASVAITCVDALDDPKLW